VLGGGVWGWQLAQFDWLLEVQHNNVLGVAGHACNVAVSKDMASEAVAFKGLVYGGGRK
jgi:hypothetical protein